MLNGIDPIIIFQFSKKVADVSDLGVKLSRIPIVSTIPTLIDQPPIPIYLNESTTGILIDSEDKNVDIDTTTETLTDGQEPETKQRGVGSTVSIQLTAKKDSLGVGLLTAMIDLVFEKLSSDEYSVTYMHGPITVFRGKVAGFQANQSANNDLMSIKIELTRGTKEPQKKQTGPVIEKETGVVPLGN